MQNELMWKNIEGYSKYEVSNTSIVRNKNTKVSVNPEISKGFNKIRLPNNEGKRVYIYMHELLCNTFIPNPDNKPYIVFIDGNKLNYSIDNLIWSDTPELNIPIVDDSIEVWKTISNCQKYQISNFGNVRNKETMNSINTKRSGKYHYVTIKNNEGKKTELNIYRLVAENLLEKTENDKYIIFKDNNTFNHCLNNLMWSPTQDLSPIDVNEEWKTIEGFSNFEISNTGRIRNKNTNNIITPRLRDGYHMLNILNDSNKKVSLTIHSAVANTFIENYDANKMVIIHIDSNKINNNVENLKWATRKEFYKHSIEHKHIQLQTENSNLEPTNENELVEGEIWKNINNFSNYQCSSQGRIRNKLTKYILNPVINGGYYCCNLTNNDNIIKSMRVHRIIALNFIDNPENKLTVNHKDHNPLNNNVTNLEWATQAEQNQHKRRINYEIHNLGGSRLVWCINKDTNEKIQQFKSVTTAGKWIIDNNYSTNPIVRNVRVGISAVCRNKSPSAYGFKWCYSDTEEQTDEIWQEIPSHHIDENEGYYVSTHGRFKNCYGCITTGSLTWSKYLKISISGKTYYLHRLVAQTFIPNPENLPVVNHKDGITTNVNLENLKWVTHKQNAQHAVRTGLIKRKTKKVIQYDLQMNRIKKFNSIEKAGKELKILPKRISEICCKKRKTTGGFIFRYA